MANAIIHQLRPPMELWVIYRQPRDFPDSFVVRCWQITPTGPIETEEVWVRPTLEEAREVVAENHPGSICIRREPTDDPVIVESWL